MSRGTHFGRRLDRRLRRRAGRLRPPAGRLLPRTRRPAMTVPHRVGVTPVLLPRTGRPATAVPDGVAAWR